MITIPVRAFFSIQLAMNISCKRLITLVQTLESLTVKGTFLHITKGSIREVQWLAITFPPKIVHNWNEQEEPKASKNTTLNTMCITLFSLYCRATIGVFCWEHCTADLK